MKKWVCSLALVGLVVLVPLRVDAQEFSVRTNLLWDAVSEPNIGLEFSVSDHWSVGGNAGLKSWPRWLAWDWETENPTHWRNFAIVPEARYYFNQVYDGLFLACDAIYTHYNVGSVKFPFGLYPEVRDYRLQGDFYGGGLSLGYSWWIAPHWRIEAEAGVGVGYVKADKFECAHCGSQVGTKEGVALVPKLGINLAYNFKRREQKKQEILEIIAPMEPEPQPAVEPEPQPVVEPEPQPVPDPILPFLQHPVVRMASEYQPYTPQRILRKEKGALYVFFPVGNADVRRSFTEGSTSRDNGPTLDEIIDVTDQILKAPIAQISCIQIIGMSSVEGASDRNRNLSLDRARALQRYIQDKLPVPSGLFEIVGGGEAWTELKDIIQDLKAGVGKSQLSSDQLDQVLEVLENDGDAASRERKLKALDGGRVYRILVETLLKDLRNSGYVRVYIESK